MTPGVVEPPGRSALLAAFRAALDRVDSGRSVEHAFDRIADANGFDRAPPGSVHVLAMGKAAVPMARAARGRLGARAGAGLVVTRHVDEERPQEAPSEGVADWTVLEAGHPVPDARSAEAGRRVLAFAAEVPRSDRLLVLLSGGTSALVATPLPGLRLDDLASTSDVLLSSGAPIREMNVVRKRLAAVSAGRLAASTRASRIDVWVVSDVVGDDLASIASGPCHPDPSGFEEALEIVHRHGAQAALPPRVRAYLEAGAEAHRRDAPVPDDPVFDRVHTRLVARSRDAVEAAAASLRAAGARAVPLGDRVTGEARERGAQWAALGRAVAAADARRRGRRPVALVAGGETTVRLGARPGQGGRNQELALAAAIGLAGPSDGPRRSRGPRPPRRSREVGIALLAAGTDGSDGPTDAAGGLVDGHSGARMRARGVDPARALDRHDALPALECSGDLVRTGPTGTNVMDLTLVWIEGARD